MKQAFKDKNYSGEELGRFYEYDVIAQGDQHIGNVSGLWEDSTGRAAFAGVKTSWLFGKTHVIPLHAAHVDAEEGHIYVPYTEDQIKNAPAFDKDEELSTQQEQEIYRYYGIAAPSAGTAWQREQRTAEQAETRGTREAPEHTMALHEEHLKVGKQQVETGAVRLRKIVRTERVNQPVELKREDVVIERVPAHEAGESGKAFSGEEQVIPLHREEAVVQKETSVREAVRVRKTEQTERQNVSGEVRKEDVEVSRGQNEGETRRRSDDPDRR